MDGIEKGFCIDLFLPLSILRRGLPGHFFLLGSGVAIVVSAILISLPKILPKTTRQCRSGTTKGASEKQPNRQQAPRPLSSQSRHSGDTDAESHSILRVDKLRER